MWAVANGAEVSLCQVQPALLFYLRCLQKVVAPLHLLVAGSAQTAPLDRFQEAHLFASVHIVAGRTLSFSDWLVPFRLWGRLQLFEKLLVAGAAGLGHGRFKQTQLS